VAARTKRLLCLALLWSGLSPALAESARQGQASASAFLADRGVLTTFEVGAGFADNVYFTPDRERTGLFADALAEAEWRFEPADSSALHLALGLDGRYYLGEAAANETTIEALADYRYAEITPALGVSDSVVYETYQLFDENGNPLPAGDSRSLANELKVSGFMPAGPNHTVEAGALYRLKNYVAIELDFDEIGAHLSDSWAISDAVDCEFSGEYRLRSYDILRAATVDGTVTPANPLMQEDVAGVEFRLVRQLQRAGEAGISAHYLAVTDRFEGEGSYAEPGIAALALVALGNRSALTADAGVDWRRYDKRLVPGSGDKEADRLVAAGIMLERVMHGLVTAYVRAEHESRDSNHYLLSYRVSAVSFGLRGVL